MSISVTTTIHCDVCNAWADGVTATKRKVQAARLEAELVGFRHYKGRDLCGHCRDKEGIPSAVRPPRRSVATVSIQDVGLDKKGEDDGRA